MNYGYEDIHEERLAAEREEIRNKKMDSALKKGVAVMLGGAAIVTAVNNSSSEKTGNESGVLNTEIAQVEKSEAKGAENAEITQADIDSLQRLRATYYTCKDPAQESLIRSNILSYTKDWGADKIKKLPEEVRNFIEELHAEK
ncbi:MAG: hypothetical protein WCW87_04335 [Candidatus Paceibacterota bacterium]